MSKFFPFRVDLLWKGFVIYGSKQQVTKVVTTSHQEMRKQHVNIPIDLNPIALRTAKSLWGFDSSECNRVKPKQ